jgi:flagellar hook-associated protein 2
MMINSVNSSSTTSFSGMVSGLDTDTMIKEMLGTYQAKVDSLNADKQKYEWQIESYQEVMTDLNDFSDKYLDVLNRDSYILSMNGSKKVEFANESLASNYVDINVNADAINNSYTINEITQLATKSEVSSSGKVIGSIDGSTDLTTLTYPLDFTEGYDFNLTLDGVTKNINLAGSYDTSSDLVNELNIKFDASFGSGRIEAFIVDNSLSLKAENSVMQVRTGSNNSFLAEVGITSGARNVVNLDRSPNYYGETDKLEFNINDVNFSFDNTTSIRDILAEINRSEAGVTMSYSTLNDEFSIRSNSTGASSSIDIENVSGSFFGADSFTKIDQGIVQNGQDAIFFLNDESKTNPIKRSSNVFTNDGVTISLKETTSESIEFNVEQNTEGVYEKIEDFVTSFNELVSGLESKLDEKIYYDYPPLTDAQKEEMTEEQIKLWEEKAKSGLLRNDQALSNIVKDLKNAFFDKIVGTNTNFYESGISLSSDYNKFELEIDQNKLEAAIEKDANSVLELFNLESEIEYSPRLTSSESSQRYGEVGFARRIHDIVKKNVTTLRNNSNNKGILVELVGVEGDTTEVNNVYFDRITQVDVRISEAIERMNQREQHYKRQFTAMEQAIAQMTAQGDAIYNMFMSN